MQEVSLSSIETDKERSSTSAYSVSKHVQSYTSKTSPVQTTYSPDGRSLLYTTAGYMTFFLHLDQKEGDSKPQWYANEQESVS